MLLNRLTRLPSTGQRQLTPLTAREGPAGTGFDACALATGRFVGKPATGTTSAAVAATGCCGLAAETAVLAVIGFAAVGVAGTGSNTGADGGLAVWLEAATLACPDVDAVSVNRWPGQIV